MKKFHIIVIQLVLLAGGAFATKKLTKSMFDEGMLQPQPNVFHLKRSPFGRTLALAMRGPVDIYWHRGAPHEHDHDHGHEDDHEHGEPCTEDHEHGPDCEHNHDDGPKLSFENGHDHSEGEHHHHGDDGPDPAAAVAAEMQRLIGENGGETEADAGAAAPPPGLRKSLLGRIEDMRAAYYSRTNTRADTRMHKAFIMGETQKRLRISYEMDPSNIACYGAYFLFLSEALARVEGDNSDPELIRHRQDGALRLAHLTVAYCVAHDDEPGAMITAATAAHDFLQLYLIRPEPNLKLAGEFLQTLDSCLMRYEKLRREMQQDGRWAKDSIHRINEMESAYSLVRTLRDLDHELFARLTGTPAPGTAPGP